MRQKSRGGFNERTEAAGMGWTILPLGRACEPYRGGSIKRESIATGRIADLGTKKSVEGEVLEKTPSPPCAEADGGHRGKKQKGPLTGGSSLTSMYNAVEQGFTHLGHLKGMENLNVKA